MSTFDLEGELKKIKESVSEDDLGMMLVHNGIVRGSSKRGDNKVSFIYLSYDKDKLDRAINDAMNNKGVKKVVAWINEGKLSIGDDIMYLIVAGDRRINILKPFEELIENIKKNVVTEKETIV